MQNVVKIETQNVMQIFVAGRPYAQTRARHAPSGHVYSNATPALKRWKAELRREIKAAQREVGVEGIEGALAVDMAFLLPTKEAKRWGELCPMKPDKDNLEKAVLDVMGDCGMFEVGDQQVACGEVVKVWCRPEEAGVLIQVKCARVAKKNPAVSSEGESRQAIDWLASL